MLISEFARTTGLSVDTVRFYIQRGLLVPAASSKGGRNRYQIFTPEHVEAVRMIRIGQSLGMSLKEIGALGKEYRRGLITRERNIEIVHELLDRLQQKAVHIEAMTGYLRAKLAWLESGQTGIEPVFPVNESKS